MRDKPMNALMDLAERMKPQGNNHLFFTVSYEDMDKAQRIVSELAKVFVKSPAGNIRLDPNASWSATLNKCRAIAEEVSNV